MRRGLAAMAAVAHAKIKPLMAVPRVKYNLNKETSYYIYHPDRIRSLYANWREALPRVTPFYAVKCNPEPIILRELAQLGARFDCASPAEISAILRIGVDPSRILYANPCKRMGDIDFASNMGVSTTTFDCVEELRKIMAVAPDMNMLLRIYANDPKAQCQLSNKFGALAEDWAEILELAQETGANLTGVSFHVGSGACTPEAFAKGIRDAQEFANMALGYGYNLNILDIGGGFGYSTMAAMAPAINKALAEAPNFQNVIAEPGRFFAETSADLYTYVIGAKTHKNGTRSYTITESLYGSFNCVVYDHAAVPAPEPITPRTGKVVPTTLFGPTCDGFDTIIRDVELPPLEIGDIIRFRNMGAYTISGASHAFNGIPFHAANAHASTTQSF